MTSILAKKRNVYSQNGEDGIIEEIFKRMNISNGNFMEFGAWDGKHLSNSYKLLTEGWSGIFIEGDVNKYNDLLKNFGNNSNVTCINQYVGYSDNDNLDTIIETSSHSNKVFDFISIDVDGLDYFIFDKLNKYLPKVICIEVSSGHMPEFNTLLPENIAKNNVGQSLKIMSQKAADKGYFPLCYTGNLFLVKNEYATLFEDVRKDLTNSYLDFLENIVLPDKDLLRYLYNLFCKPEGKHMQKSIFNNYSFPINTYIQLLGEKNL